MSNDIQKADQIAFHFYTKLFYAVNDARATTVGQKAASKVDKWFNLETPDSDLFTKEAREPYRNVSQAPASGPAPFEIQVLLSVPELTNNQVLVYMSPDSFRVRIEPTPKFIVLETWTLECAPHLAGYNEQFNSNADVALPIIYKHGIVLFRSVFSMLRILPAWKFYKRLRRKTSSGVNRNGSFGIQLRTRPLSSVDPSQSEFLEFHHPPSPIHRQPFPTSTRTFPPIPHILGILTLTTTYLDNPNFQLDELESLLSSRFISLDREEFVPTLEKNRRRDSMIGSSLPSSTGSKSIASSRSPPTQIARATSTGSGGGGGGGGSGSGGGVLPGMSVAERFILPSSIGTSASTGSSALIPPPRPFPPMTPSPTTTTTTLNNNNNTSPSGLALNSSRLRKESMNSSSSSSSLAASTKENVVVVVGPATTSSSSPLSSSSPSASSGPVPIRKPSIFKANTVSSASGSSPSSLSIRQQQQQQQHQAGQSSLTRDNNNMMMMGGSGSGSSSHSRQQSSVAARLPPSPIGTSSAAPIIMSGSPSTSLGDRRPGTSGSGSGGGASFDRERRVSTISNNGFAATATAAVEEEEGVPSTTTTTTMPTRKRYSSSFGHRYSASGGSSSSTTGATPITDHDRDRDRDRDGGGVVVVQGVSSVTPGAVGGGGGAQSQAAGGGGGSSTSGSYSPVRGAIRRSRSGTEGLAVSYLGATAAADDYDEISDFVQEIDSRKPLIGHAKQHGRSHHHQMEDEAYRNRFLTTTDAPTTTTTNTTSPLHRSLSVPNETEQQQQLQQQQQQPQTATTTTPVVEDSSTSPPRGLMLTSQGEVDERLSKMKEVFLKSIEGLGSGGSGGGGGGTRRRKDLVVGLVPTPTAATATSSGSGSKASSHTVTPPRERGGVTTNVSSSSSSRSDPLASRGMNLGIIGFPIQGGAAGAASPSSRLARPRYATTTSSSTLGSSSGDVGTNSASRGLEEVIGRMDLYEEEERRRQ